MIMKWWKFLLLIIFGLTPLMGLFFADDKWWLK
jgi:hypothetical protein